MKLVLLWPEAGLLEIICSYTAEQVHEFSIDLILITDTNIMSSSESELQKAPGSGDRVEGPAERPESSNLAESVCSFLNRIIFIFLM